MKKIIILAGAIALFLGCTNEENVTQSSNDLKDVFAQAGPIAVGTLDNISFRDYVVPGTTNAVYWKAGDEIALVQDDNGTFQGSGNHHPFTYDNSKGLQELICKGHFTRNTAEDHEGGTITGGDYIVVYPYGLYSQEQYTLNGGKLHFNFPQTQTQLSQTQLSNGSLDNFGPTDFMYSNLFPVLQKEFNNDFTEQTGSAVFQFQHAMTWLNVNVKGFNTDEIITSIVVNCYESPGFFSAIELAPDLTPTFVNPKTSVTLNTNNYKMSVSETYYCWITINKLAPGTVFDINVNTSEGSWDFQKTAPASGLLVNTVYPTTLTLPPH